MPIKNDAVVVCGTAISPELLQSGLKYEQNHGPTNSLIIELLANQQKQISNLHNQIGNKSNNMQSVSTYNNNQENNSQNNANSINEPCVIHNKIQSQFIYLLREREFIRLNEHTYKLGKTKQEPNSRLSGYPKGSEIIIFLQVNDCDELERVLLDSFKCKFTHKKEYGREYFEGNKEEMIKEITKKCQQQINHKRHDTQ